jgi:tetratricopeptide (TPR) repeat protein
MDDAGGVRSIFARGHTGKTNIGPFQYEIPGYSCQPLGLQGDTAYSDGENCTINGNGDGDVMILDVVRDVSQHPTPALEREAGGAFTRKEVCRLLKVEPRQLRSWERQRLVPELAQYKFRDLLKLKRLIRLRDEKTNPRLMSKALHSLERYLKDSPGLSEDVQVYKDGRRVRIQIGRQKMEAGSGQLLFDFAEEEISKLLQLPGATHNARNIAEKLRDKLEADRWFEHALELEQQGAQYEEIIAAYEKAATLDPRSAGALVNLGTVFFNGHAWADAEEHYKKALAVDPQYALAHFNLGNLYDEQGDQANALHHYQEALRLYPNYADAHYNMALLQQTRRDVMGALRHWRAYLKLDPTSTWAQIARRELSKLEATTVLQGTREIEASLRMVKRMATDERG